MNESGSGYPRQVIFSLSLSLAVVLAARGLQYVNESKGRRLANPLPELGGIESFMAWAVILVFLIAMAEMDQTGPLGASFGWLIFVAVLFAFGQGAFDNLRVLIAQDATAANGGSTTEPQAYSRRTIPT